MVIAATRAELELRRLIRRLERRTRGIADVAREVGRYCDREGFTRPSYEQVRVLFHEARARRERRVAAVELMLEVNLRTRPPSDLHHLFEDPRDAPPRRRR
jgi:hypothetical protein